MKNWVMPEVEELEISATAQGTDKKPHNDDVFVDGNSMKWFSYNSGVVTEEDAR